MKIYNEDASASDDIGIADNDIDAFLKHLESVAREIGQNSTDGVFKQSVTKWFFAKLDIGSESRDKEAPISPFLFMNRSFYQNIMDTNTDSKKAAIYKK